MDYPTQFDAAEPQPAHFSRFPVQWRVMATLVVVALLGSTGIFWWTMAGVAQLSIQSSLPTPEPIVQSKVPQSKNTNAANPSGAGAKRYGWDYDMDRQARISILREEFEDNLFSTQREEYRPPVQRAAPDPLDTAPPVRQADLAAPATKSAGPKATVERERLHRREGKPEPRHAAASKPHRIATRSYYVEKVVEQGDAGDIQFHYQRRSCAPPNRVDVCFMPPQNRREIVIQQW